MGRYIIAQRRPCLTLKFILLDLCYPKDYLCYPGSVQGVADLLELYFLPIIEELLEDAEAGRCIVRYTRGRWVYSQV